MSKESQDKIQSLLDAGHTKELRNKIITYVGSSKPRMAALMHFFFHEKWRYGQRAAWPIGHLGSKQPKLIEPYLERMVKGLDDANHDAVARNTIRIFADIAIPENLEGPLYDKCMAYVLDLKQPIAIRCFSLSVLKKIAEPYPELQEELLAVVHEYMPHGSAGFKVRCRRILKAFG